MNQCRAFLCLIFIYFVLLCLNVDSAFAQVNWPPRINESFPDVVFKDQDGNSVRVSDFKGKVVLVEFVGMSCTACQALSGAKKYGSYANITPQPGLKSIEEYCPFYAFGTKLEDERIVFIQILLFDLNMKAPSVQDVKDWADHFRLNERKNSLVLFGTPELVNSASFNLIPGFQLLDRNLIVRQDSTGHNPKNDLYKELLPQLAKLVREVK